MKSVFFKVSGLVLVCIFGGGARAQIPVYQSATLGPTGVWAGWYTIGDPLWLGCRFHLPVETAITGVGGHLFRPFYADGRFFAAITRIESLSALPAPPGPPFIAANVVATGVFNIESSLSADYVFPLSVTLPAGNYALVFGSGLFGDPHTSNSGVAAAMPINNTDLPGASYIAWDGLPYQQWRAEESGVSRIRFVVYGIPRNPPVAIVYVSPTINACPTAYCDIYGTHYFVIAPPGGSASVVLDASASYDPDGDPITFLWAELDDGQWFFSTNARTTQVLSESTRFRLYVSDGTKTTTNTFNVVLLTPEQVVTGLIDLEELEMDQGIQFRRRNSLQQMLRKAAQLLAANETRAAVKHLRQFQTAIANQSALIGQVHADNLISIVQAVIDTVSPSQ
jgi:hypothetical protein